MPDQNQTQTPQEFIRAQARSLGVPEALALGIADQESSFNPLAVGQEFDFAPGKKTRAYGMFQVLPETAVRYGADPANPLKSVQDPVQNVQIGLRYLKALHDQYGGNLDQVLKTYGGVRTDTTYVPTATAKILQWQKKLEQEKAAAGPVVPGAGGPVVSSAGGASPPAEPTWAQQHPYLSTAIGVVRAGIPSVNAGMTAVEHLDPKKHPYLNAAIESFDPNEREARQNIAGLVGGIGGAFLGGPVGSVAGAGVLGAAENALIEETGLGDKLARLFPGAVNGPPPAPDSTPAGRTLEAGAWQAGGDLVGQGVGTLVKGAAKRFLQTGVAKSAYEHFAKVKTDAIESLRNAVETLTEMAGRQTVARNQAGRAAAEAAQQNVKEVARTGAADVWAARAAQASTTAQARDAATRSVQDAGARAADLFKRSQAEGAAGVAQAAADAAAGMPPRPPFIDAGQAVIDAVEGPARDAYRALGQAVDDAASSATGDVDIRALKEEARRIARQELLPPETSFPRTDPVAPPPPAPPPPSPIIDPSTGKPVVRPVPDAGPAAVPDAAGAAGAAADDPLAQLAVELSDKEREALKNNPAMHVIGRILRAGDTVPFKDAHLWKSQLQAAIRGTYDAVQRGQAENITMHAARELRQALSGNPAYDAATAAYEAASPAFTEQVAQTIRSVARDSPEQIVELLNPERPSHARTLVSLLTDYAGRGGEAGEAAGRAALEQVRGAWLHKNVFEGGIEGLGERLAALRARPEFAEAVFGNEYKEVFTNLDAVVKAYNAKVLEATALETAAKMQGKHGVRTAKDAGRAAVESARERAAAAVQATRTTAKAAKDEAVGQGKTAVEAARRAKEGERLVTAKALREARRAVQKRQAGVGGTPEEAAERAFAASSLGGRNMRSAEQTAADLMHAVLLGPKNVWGGLSWARIARGATDADLIKYAVFSSKRTQQLVAALKAAKYAGPAVGAATKTLRTIDSDKQAARRARNAAEDEARRRGNAPAVSDELFLSLPAGGR